MHYINSYNVTHTLLLLFQIIIYFLKVYSEGVAALKSIISEEELKEFSYGTRAAKEEHLNEMTKLITGIRLFNKYCQRGGAEIPDCKYIFQYFQ